MQGRAVLLVMLALWALSSAAALAGEPPVPIEGQLITQVWDGANYSNNALVGSSDNAIPVVLPAGCTSAVPSPVQDRYAVRINYVAPTPTTPASGDIGTVAMDGSDLVNLTDLAGLGGLNCNALWSPDGSQIAFVHADPAPGAQPCDGGFSVWVISADGTGLHRVTPLDIPNVILLDWAPNGYRLLGQARFPEVYYHFTIDSDGTDLASLPYLGGWGEWSRDGSHFVMPYLEHVDEPTPGWWKFLRVWTTDATQYEDVVEHFLSDAEIGEITAAQGVDPGRVLGLMAPGAPLWSPRGDRAAFGGIFEFDPYGIDIELQSEVWVCDIATHDVTRLTNNSVGDYAVQWDGFNTFDYDLEVTVDNTTVLFDQILNEGLTTIIRDDDLPMLPTGFMFAGESYRITTTCTPTGPVTVEMTYRDEVIPTSVEQTLSIYHWDQGTQAWEDITVSRDPINNTVTGITDSLSPFGMITLQRFNDVAFSHWAYGYIEACVAAGLVSGYQADGTYRPGNTVLREQMAVFLARALTGDAVPTGPVVATFTDVAPGHWAYDHIEYVAAEQVAMGFASDGGYHPRDPVTRGAMAAFIARSMEPIEERPGLPSYTPPPTAPSFLDVVPDFMFYKPIEYLKEHGVASGYAAEGKYHPEYQCKRDQMAVFLAKAFGLL